MDTMEGHTSPLLGVLGVILLLSRGVESSTCKEERVEMHPGKGIIITLTGARSTQCKTYKGTLVMECHDGNFTIGDEYKGHIRGSCDKVELYNILEAHYQPLICEHLDSSADCKIVHILMDQHSTISPNLAPNDSTREPSSASDMHAVIPSNLTRNNSTKGPEDALHVWDTPIAVGVGVICVLVVVVVFGVLFLRGKRCPGQTGNRETKTPMLAYLKSPAVAPSSDQAGIP